MTPRTRGPGASARLEYEGFPLLLRYPDRRGHIALVETFQGERNFYYYIATSVGHAATVDTVRQNHAGVTIAAQSRSDAAWSFIAEYRKMFQLAHSDVN